MKKFIRSRKFLMGASLVGLATLGAISSVALDQNLIGEARAQSPGDTMVPWFEVDPYWPKPLPNHWILAMTIGLDVDKNDNVWVFHRPQTLEQKESYATRGEADCCTAAPDVRKRMLQLADAELVHRAKMERKYREATGNSPPDPGPVNVELASDIYDLDMARALKLALERERDSESYYRFMAERVPGTTELGRLFMELAEIEWKHKTDLQGEYDANSPPDQFLMDI